MAKSHEYSSPDDVMSYVVHFSSEALHKKLLSEIVQISLRIVVFFPPKNISANIFFGVLQKKHEIESKKEKNLK